MKQGLKKLTSNMNNRERNSLFRPATAHDYQTLAGSVVEPSNPKYGSTWGNQQSQQTSNCPWILYIVIGLGVILIILLIIFLTLPDSSPTQEAVPEENPATITDDSIIDEDADLNRFFAALAEDPESSYMPDFSASKDYYSQPPTDLSCEALKEVKYMDSTILSLYLDNGSVVVVSGKWNTPVGGTSKAILIFGGSLTESIYKTVPISCPESSDNNLKIPTPSINKPYINYTGAELFDDLTADRHFYVWPGATSASSGEE